MNLGRDDHWLEVELRSIWRGHFSDVVEANPVGIGWGRRARSRFGSIRLMKDGSSRILINGAFRSRRVPVAVVRATIAHELVHYAHGFSSKHPQLYRHPHHGGIVDRELVARGLGEVLDLQKSWTKEEWEQIAPPRQPRRHRLKWQRVPFRLF